MGVGAGILPNSIAMLVIACGKVAFICLSFCVTSVHEVLVLTKIRSLSMSAYREGGLVFK